MKYKENYGGSMGSNLRLFTDDGTEIGHFYPSDGFDPDGLGWVDLDDPDPAPRGAESFPLIDPDFKPFVLRYQVWGDESHYERIIWRETLEEAEKVAKDVARPNWKFYTVEPDLFG